ncbi:hypothetical protein NIES37_32940 [Tolypothrix tenuis PCC 7101]|uniref:Uncharacterized protein n=1 Tax=Tolypothrix tenuis PCC 7101 TaxID=231146 RepID=A0A1Z4N0R0_9CYAN|nr:hypothetical protein [Aulosira sp. FACHB-113]BAY28930.1 hypothetical protein NIES2107_07680 [Nostoc carneum NIES-2107]BAY99315.1 hypothetical protein NIES37_32940 [Tolypothrix tenuis PCC 7101]BAZ76762.1 hypothetical protein NIES50_53640 [Aulosira laxa NIES-50]
MKPVDLTTTDGIHVEINPNAISEIVEVEEKEPGFLFFPGKDAVYEIHMVDREVYRVTQDEHDKLNH